MTRSFIKWNFDQAALTVLDTACAEFKIFQHERPDEQFLSSGLIEYVNHVISTFFDHPDPSTLSAERWEYFYLSAGLGWHKKGIKSKSIRSAWRIPEDLDGIIYEEYIRRLTKYKLIRHQIKHHYLSFTRFFRGSVFQAIGRAIRREHEAKLVILAHYIQEDQEPYVPNEPTKDISRLTGLSRRQVQRYLS